MKKRKKPSQTAVKVALNIVALGHLEKLKEVLPENIVDATVNILYASEATNVRKIKMHQSPNIIGIYRKFDWLLPGQFEALGYRKSIFERNVKEAIEKGVSQVLVLGSGFDTLCYRLSSKFPNIKFFEIDHPDTAIYKSNGMEKLVKAENHYILQEDLSKKKLIDVLENYEDWDIDTKSIITAEGLLQYLPPSSVNELFKQCAIVTGEGSKIAFTYIGRASNGKPDAGPRSRIMLWILKLYGEAWLWATNMNDLKNLLESNRWKFSECINQNEKVGVEYFACAEKI